MDSFTISQLQTTQLFAGINSSDIPLMLNCIGGHERKYAKSEYISMEGDLLKNIGLLLSGKVHMIKEDNSGNKMILSNFTSGEVFGESFVCQNATMSTMSFLASSDCRILFLPFRRLLTTCEMSCRFHQQLIENMVLLLATKNVKMMNKMEILSKRTIREKILVWLSQQTQMSGSSCFCSPLGRVELAEYLCIDRSALTRELGNMKRDGILNFNKNNFEYYTIT